MTSFIRFSQKALHVLAQSDDVLFKEKMVKMKKTHLSINAHSITHFNNCLVLFTMLTIAAVESLTLATL